VLVRGDISRFVIIGQCVGQPHDSLFLRCRSDPRRRRCACNRGIWIGSHLACGRLMPGAASLEFPPTFSVRVDWVIEQGSARIQVAPDTKVRDDAAPQARRSASLIRARSSDAFRWRSFVERGRTRGTMREITFRARIAGPTGIRRVRSGGGRPDGSIQQIGGRGVCVREECALQSAPGVPRAHAKWRSGCNRYSSSDIKRGKIGARRNRPIYLFRHSPNSLVGSFRHRCTRSCSEPAA
jgi:hypothetical protein